MLKLFQNFPEKYDFREQFFAKSVSGRFFVLAVAEKGTSKYLNKNEGFD